MDALRVASSRARLLLALAEAERDCDVLAGRGAGRLRLRLVRGRAVAIAGADIEPLGDTLRALGALDADSARAIVDDPHGAPIGARLIAAGATSVAAVRSALRMQLFHGVSLLLRWPVGALDPVACSRAESLPNTASIDLTAAVWGGMFRIASELPTYALARLSGTAALTLTELGRRRVQGLLRAEQAGELSLAFQSARVAPAAGLSAPTGDVLARALAADPPPDVYAARAILRVLGSVLDAKTNEDAYALLFRKRRELSRKASATALLDLVGPTSDAHVRRALRRLAQKLHPDRFESADDRLRAVSAEVMRGLSSAASELGSRSTHAP